MKNNNIKSLAHKGNAFYDAAKEYENEDIDSENEEKNDINASNMNISESQFLIHNLKIM